MQLLVDPTDYLDLPQDLILTLLTKSLPKGSDFVLQGWTSQASTKSAAQMALLESAVIDCSQANIERNEGLIEESRAESEPVRIREFGFKMESGGMLTSMMS